MHDVLPASGNERIQAQEQGTQGRYPYDNSSSHRMREVRDKEVVRFVESQHHFTARVAHDEVCCRSKFPFGCPQLLLRGRIGPTAVGYLTDWNGRDKIRQWIRHLADGLPGWCT